MSDWYDEEVDPEDYEGDEWTPDWDDDYIYDDTDDD